MPAGISTVNLTKQYHGTTVPSLVNLSLEVQAGEVYGYLGSNGAGKSTTIRLLMNFLQPTSGSARIMGYDAVKDSVEVKKHTGYLAGDIALYPKVTGRELLDYLAALQGLRDTAYLQTLVKRFEADLDKPLKQLSKGNRQKIGIIQACMHQPSVLILDEPTSGLDPLMQERFYETIMEAKMRGAAVFLSSHSLGEVQHICDRVGIIKNGALVREGTLEDFAADQLPTFTVTFKQAAPATDAFEKTAAVISSHDRTLVLKPTVGIAPLLSLLSRYEIVDLQTKTEELEQEFMSYYGNQNPESGQLEERAS